MVSPMLLAALVAGANAVPNYLHARQGVTSAVSPSAAAPSGCTVNYSSSFGIAALNATVTASASSCSTASASVNPVTQISDGQIQATTSVVINPITQISDGQIQAPTSTMTMAAITQIGDGQIQAPYSTVQAVSQIADGQIQAPQSTVQAVTQISDGQIQAPESTVAPISQISDGQIQAPTSTVAPVSQISDGQIQAPSSVDAVSQISDGQIQAPTSTVGAVSQISDGQIQATDSATTGNGTCTAAGVTEYVSCASNSTLSMTLTDGVLTDSQGRTGYIASNYQFQFDAPAQAGAIYTAGWSVCSNGSLALGGSAIFYQCLSGDFYNLYDRNWAAQCNAVTLQIVDLVDCSD